MARLAAISVDLDEISAYGRIHDLPTPPTAEHLVYDLGLERAEAFARAHALPLTLFVVGADLARPSQAARLRGLGDAGHALGNHSLDHLYDLTRRSRETIESQVRGATAAIEAATGRRPRGFRAPGYTLTDELAQVLSESDVLYDSSVFPCPSYFLAKAAARGLIRLRGRRTATVLDRPSVLRAPSAPYRLGRPYWQRGSGLLELPIAVTRRLRLPFIGTTLTLLGPDRARWLARGMVGAPLVNLELHGLDFLGATDGLGWLRGVQPDVAVPLERKSAALGAAVEVLREAGYAFVTLDEAASVMGRAT